MPHLFDQLIIFFYPQNRNMSFWPKDIEHEPVIVLFVSEDVYTSRRVSPLFISFTFTSLSLKYNDYFSFLE